MFEDEHQWDKEVVMEVLKVDLDVSIDVDHDLLEKHQQIMIVSEIMILLFHYGLDDLEEEHLVFVHRVTLVVFDVLFIFRHLNLIE